jgi:hypothetical protein
MIQNMSWHGYWTFMSLILFGYYLIVFLLYFRKAFASDRGYNNKFSHDSINRSVPLFDRDHHAKSVVAEAETQLTPGATAEETIVETCMDELTAFFEQCKSSRVVAGELVFGLRRIVQKFPSLKDSEYKQPLERLIISQAQHICSVQLSEAEVESVWMVN